MRGFLAAAAAVSVLTAAGAADAAQYLFSYGFNGSTIASGTITTDSTPTGPGSLNVVDITGSRLGEAITGFDYFADFGDQLIYPASSTAKVDGSGITFQIGDYSYNVYSTGGFYNEFRYLTADPFQPGEGTFVTSFTLTAVTSGPVPEPGAWTLLILGTGLAGAALRRRTAVAA